MNFGLPDFMQAWLCDLGISGGHQFECLILQQSILLYIFLQQNSITWSSCVISKGSLAKSFGSGGLSLSTGSLMQCWFFSKRVSPLRLYKVLTSKKILFDQEGLNLLVYFDGKSRKQSSIQSVDSQMTILAMNVELQPVQLWRSRKIDLHFEWPFRATLSCGRPASHWIVLMNWVGRT